MVLTEFLGAQLSRRLHRSRTGFRTYLTLYRSRQTLARLDARALEDIGICSEAAQAEARRPAWDVPDTWVRR
ncbi:hypothetical protein [uncultured Roseobacter sp.]|uniref:DUF1127 domain-containing protein n=1 Tax=uncultured Roseobacter sp. TaxID=114847 RepID=UPI00262A8297|nr:hypothetical protein [uncultured Roseobacter sp.]